MFALPHSHLLRLHTACTTAAAVLSIIVGIIAPTPTPATQPGSQSSATPGPLPGADALLPQMKSDTARQFLNAVPLLPIEPTRRIFKDTAKNTWHSATQAATMPSDVRAALTPRAVDYYNTFYGSPLAYARAIELVADKTQVFKSSSLQRAKQSPRILDFGYGTVGHARLLALLGCDVVGVDVDPRLTALYCEPRDTGRVTHPAGMQGRITLVEGRWPADADSRRQVGGGFDLIMSKNTLKNGYLHPAQPVDKRMLVDLGVSEPAFLRALHDALNPRGCVLIYNICPALTPPGPNYKPWSDGKCPFTPEQWKAAEFELIDFDIDDTAAVKALALALGWNKGDAGMDVEHDLTAHYTLARRK